MSVNRSKYSNYSRNFFFIPTAVLATCISVKFKVTVNCKFCNGGFLKHHFSFYPSTTWCRRVSYIYIFFFFIQIFRNAHVQNVDAYPVYETFSSNKNISNSTSRIGIDCVQERYFIIYYY